MKKLFLVFALLLVASLPIFAQEEPVTTEEPETEAAEEMQTNEMMTDAPDVIELERTGLIPEGIEYDMQRDRFLVGSLSEGSIFSFGTDGNLEVFIEDDRLISSIGIHIDEDTDRLLVAVSNAAVVFGEEGAEPLAALAAYDLETGENLFFTELTDITESQSDFANDVTVDDNGNAYVTNSFEPVIYMVTPEGEASVFVEDAQLAAQGFGANGIIYHPDGYLLVAIAGSGELYNIPVGDPSAVLPVELENPLGFDGMILTPENNLVGVASIMGEDGDASQAIVMLSSDDDWTSAMMVGMVPTDGNATTVALRGDSIYYTKAYFNNPQQEVYDITRVALAELEGEME